MRIRTIIFATIMVLPCARGLSAQQPGRIETRTRLVSQFSELQTQWMDAIKNKDAAALDRLLAQDFEVWTPAHSGPIPREDWQAQALVETLKSFRFGNMAVKSPREGIAIESFRLETTTSRNGGDATQQFFIVNLWISDKEGWRCTDSYVSPVQAAPPTVPAKPTGKD